MMSIGNKKSFKKMTVHSDVEALYNSTSSKSSPTSTELTSSLSTCNVPKINRPSDVYDFWNNTEVAQSIHFKPQYIQPSVFNNELVNNFEPTGSSQHSTVVHISGKKRDGNTIQRKSTVVDLGRKVEKQHRQTVTVSAITLPETDFTLQQSPEEFPLLSTVINSKKKYKVNQTVSTSKTENSIELNCNRRHKASEKSWKPKVKDPISFDISRALQIKHEKCKSIVKKVDPTAQRNIVKGNILDADNPQQKKGKVRPDKQKKPSKLKKQILLERQERQNKPQCEKEQNFPSSDARVIQEDELIPKTSELVGVEERFEENDHRSNSNLSEEVSVLLTKCNLLETDPKQITNDEYSCLNSKQDLKLETKRPFHSKNFREYCTNFLTEDIITCVCSLLEKLAFFQDRTFARDPIRAQAKRRYVAGISQTNKYLLVKKVKLLVIAPDLEKNSVEGGLDDIIRSFKNIADDQDVPYVFGPRRKRLGKAVFKKALVSCVAVLSYEGAEEQFSRVIEALDDAKMKYQALIKQEPIIYDKKNTENSFQLVDKDYISADEVTSSLLAVLKGNQTSADRLLNAIHRADWSSLDT